MNDLRLQSKNDVWGRAVPAVLLFTLCGIAIFPSAFAAQSPNAAPTSKSVTQSQPGTVPAKPVAVAPLPAVEKPTSAPVTPSTHPENPVVREAKPRVEKPDEIDASDPAAQGGKAVRPLDSKAGARRPYVIGPEDVLRIRVWQEANLSGDVTVGSDGMISLQLIDEVKADGLTAEQLKGVITERLKAFIVNPDVNVQLLRGNSQKFIIQGEVRRPGSFALTGPTTVFDALVSGNGFQEFAKSTKIYILRTSVDPKTKKVEVQKFKFNYKEVSHGKKLEQNILIQNGDQIFVP